MIGPGKYDDLCTYVRETSKARAALVIIIDGEHGAGFSCQAPMDVQLRLSMLLRDVADKLEHENPELYEAAKNACFSIGAPWTDPRTGLTHFPPKKP